MPVIVAEVAAGGGLDTLTTAFSWILERFTSMASQMLSTPLFLIGIAILRLVRVSVLSSVLFLNPLLLWHGSL